MSNPLNKYCSVANDLKDVKDAMNKIQKLRAQMKNPTRDGMIEALRDAKKCADRNFGLGNGAGGDKLGAFFRGIRQYAVHTSWTV